MIHIFLGTKAQLIKMAPVMVELQRRDIAYNFIFSGQHQATVSNIREEFGVKDPDIVLYSGRDITGILQMLLWSIRIMLFTLWNRKKVWQGDRKGVVLNHGDTFSTLLGSLLGRISGHHCAHVEAGLRSFNLFHPFPEELTRILTFRLSNTYFAPGDWALSNLEKYTGVKVNTVHNTLLDALRTGEAAIETSTVAIPENPFAVVSLHRFENIFSQKTLTDIVDLLVRISGQLPLLFILHKPTESKLKQYGLYRRLEDCPHIELRPRYSYFQFIKLIKQARLVITDGGSNQEECYYMGKPCIIMRNTSERQEGIGLNAVVSEYDYQRMLPLLEDSDRYAITPEHLDISPSRIIVDELTRQEHGSAMS